MKSSEFIRSNRVADLTPAHWAADAVGDIGKAGARGIAAGARGVAGVAGDVVKGLRNLPAGGNFY